MCRTSRLVARGRDDAAVIERRMGDARREMSHCPEYDVVIVNDDFDSAVQRGANVVVRGDRSGDVVPAEFLDLKPES